MTHLVRSATFTAPAKYRGRPVVVRTDERGRVVDWRVIPAAERPSWEANVSPFPRGVHVLPFLTPRGHRYLMAVDRDGDYVTHAELASEAEADRLTQDLQAFLDVVDPVDGRFGSGNGGEDAAPDAHRAPRAGGTGAERATPPARSRRSGARDRSGAHATDAEIARILGGPERSLEAERVQAAADANYLRVLASGRPGPERSALLAIADRLDGGEANGS